MIVTNAIRTIALASIVAAGSLALFAQGASAEEPVAPTVSEIVVTKATDDGDVDGRDFLVWQRNPPASDGGEYELTIADSSDSDSSGYNTWRTNFGRTGY